MISQFVQGELVLRIFAANADHYGVMTPDTTPVRTTSAFSIREAGYDVLQVDARVAALEARIAELEDGVNSDGDLLTDTRFQALRLLMSARQDAETMVEEARRQAADLLARAESAEHVIAEIPSLEPRLESIKSELPHELQRAFAAVAARRG